MIDQSRPGASVNSTRRCTATGGIRVHLADVLVHRVDVGPVWLCGEGDGQPAREVERSCCWRARARRPLG
jgi:hypothetical protein